MKKIKLLTPMLSIAAVSAVAAPLMSSCAVVTVGSTIPTDLLNIVGYTLKGFKAGVDLSNYTTLVIPEGVKYIDNEAFADVFVTGSKTNIEVISLPTTLREIRTDAFKNCDSVRAIYMNNWSANNIYYLTVADGAFAGMSHIGQVVLGDNLTDEGKDKAKSLLSETGGLSSIWFEQESEDKMTADAAWKVQKKQGGRNASYLFTCNVTLPVGYEIYAQVTRINSTKGVDVECQPLVTVKDSNVFEVKVGLLNQAETDDFADFAITFAAVKNVGSETTFLWKQTLTGFKLSNVKSEKVEVEEIKLNADEESLDIGKTLQIQSQVLPVNATDKSIEWKSSNNAVATVSDSGLVTGVAEGEVTIYAIAKDGSGTKGYINLEVNAEVIEVPVVDYREGSVLPREWMNKGLFQMDGTIVSKITTDVRYKFIADGDAITSPSFTQFAPGTFCFVNQSDNWCGFVESSVSINYTDASGTKPLGADDFAIQLYPSGQGGYIYFKKDFIIKSGTKLEISLTFDKNQAAGYKPDGTTSQFVALYKM